MSWAKRFAVPLRYPSDAEHAYGVEFLAAGYSHVSNVEVAAEGDRLTVTFDVSRSRSPLSDVPRARGNFTLPVAIEGSTAVSLSEGVSLNSPETVDVTDEEDITSFLLYVLHPEHSVDTTFHDYVGDLERDGHRYPVFTSMVTLH